MIACPLWSPVRSLGSLRDIRRRQTKFRGLIRGCSSGGGLESEPFSRRVRGAPASRRSLETRSVPSSGAGPSQNGTFLGGSIGSNEPGWEKYCNLGSVLEDPSLYTPVSMGSLGENCRQSYHTSSAAESVYPS